MESIRHPLSFAGFPIPFRSRRWKIGALATIALGLLLGAPAASRAQPAFHVDVSFGRVGGGFRLSPGIIFYRIRAQEGEATGRFNILN